MKRLPVRDRLIDTATELFYQQGYNRTGINEILEKSSVAKASMYQHFRSKEEIAVEFLRKKDRELNEQLRAYLENKKKGRHRILGVFDFLQLFFDDKGFRGCWCLNTLSEISADDRLLSDEIHGQKTKFRRFMRELVKENLVVKNASEVADQLYLLYESGLSESFVHNADWPIKQARKIAQLLIK